MNPLTNVRNIENLSKRELELGVPIEKSWHQQYKDSAWLFIGGLNYELTEGDVVCVFSQYGEVVNINLIRDRKTGKSKGFAFLCYADQRSTTLAVDNFNGIKLASRVIRVDHVENYKVPKIREDMDEKKKRMALEGCAPKPTVAQEPEPDVLDIKPIVIKEEKTSKRKHSKKEKKKRKKQKKSVKKKKKRSVSSSSSSLSDSSSDSDSESDRWKKNRVLDTEEGYASYQTIIKTEKHDMGYDKNDTRTITDQNPVRSRPREGESRSKHNRWADDYRHDSADRYSRSREHSRQHMDDMYKSSRDHR